MIRLLCTLLLGASTAFAQPPLMLVTTTGAGSFSDTAARHFAPLLEKELGRPVLVQNIPGANGIIGLRAFNGMTGGDAILIAGTVNGFVSITAPQPDFDPLKDFVPVFGLAETPQLLLVKKDSPIKSFSDLRGRRLMGGSSHPSTDMSIMVLDQKVGSETTLVRYKQISQLATELAGGFVDFTIGGAGNAATQGLFESGLVRSIGEVTSVGVPAFSWLGFFAHSKAISAQKPVIKAIERVMLSAEAKSYEQPNGRRLMPVPSSKLLKIQDEEAQVIKSLPKPPTH